MHYHAYINGREAASGTHPDAAFLRALAVANREQLEAAESGIIAAMVGAQVKRITVLECAVDHRRKDRG